MSKKSDGNRAVIIDDQFVPMLRSLPKEQAGELFQAMLDYQCDEDVKIEDPSMMAIFSMLRESIDKHNEAYEKKRLAQIENGKKGGRPKKQSVSEESEENPWVSVETQENPQKAVMVRDKDIEKKKSPTETKKKTEPVRHKRGEYGHVLLSDDEYQKLITDFGEQMAKDAIQVVDNYCESHGVTYKRYNAVIRDWGIKRVKEDAEKKQKRASPQYHNRYNDFPQRNNDYKQIEEEWIRRAFGA